MRGVIAGLASLLVTGCGIALAQSGEAGARHKGLGVVYGEIETARSVCPGLAADMAALDVRLSEAGIDPKTPSAAFSAGIKEADERAGEAIANERLRSFCADIVRAYGPQGESIPGLVAKK